MDVSTIPHWCAGYIGIPFKTGGTDRNGLDCWGLINLVWKEQFGRSLPDYNGMHWSRGSSPAAVSEGAASYSQLFRKIAKGEEQPGDGILFRMIGHPIHIALVVAPGWMLHIEEDTDSLVDRYQTLQWERRIIDFYRYE